MTRLEIIKHIKDFCKINSIPLPDDKIEETNVIEFAEYILQKEREDIDTFVRHCLQTYVKEQNLLARNAKVGQVWMCIKSGIKQVVDVGLLISIKGNPEDYEYICEYPHADNDYSYMCNANPCKCKEHAYKYA